MINKNDELFVEITDQDDQGNGIGKADGFPFFIRHGVTGDKVKIGVTKLKKNYGYARIIEFIEASKDRIRPACEVYKRCGGCQLQMMNYEAQLMLKQRKVEECLKRIGGCTDIKVDPIIGADKIFRYRNKAQYPVGADKNGLPACGFFAERSHNIIAHEDCLLSPEEFRDVTTVVLDWMKNYDIPAYDEEKHTGLVRHIFIREGKEGELGVCLVINGNKLPCFEALKDELISKAKIVGISISPNKKRGNVIMGESVKCLYGREYIEDNIGEVRYRISPLSFYQINREQTKKLYDKALEYADLKGDETVLDLYCGIGTIALYAAKKAGNVIGIEIVPKAIEDAKINAELNNSTNTSFYCGKAEEVLPRLYEEGVKKADVVIVDPPRKGCDEVALDTIVKIDPKRLVYVSCNPATLARDIKYLGEKGYKPVKIQPVDMFPNTVHVETVVWMSKVNTVKI